ncbi:MAG: GIY-YIG nuclease family protein [Candidatus Kerfeldbacteria bacterium]|jgi:putative endonuclease
MNVYTYLIYSNKFNKYYCGISIQPWKRIHEHNQGKLNSSSKYKLFKLVYFKKHHSYKEARRHELWLKKKNHQYKNKLAQLAPPLIGGVK